MEKIKDLTKVILPENAMLAEVIKPKRYIVAPDGTEDEDSYGVIIALHPSVKDMEIGDVVIKYGGQMFGYTINSGLSNEKMYAIMHRGAINVAVKADNFINPDKITESVNV